jgi:hypothetical protein
MDTYLRANGINDVWIDKERITGGVSLTPTIMEAIQKANCCVALLTKEYIASGWCNAEIGAFLANNKKVIPYQSRSGNAGSPLLQGITICKSPDELLASIPIECKQMDDSALQRTFVTLAKSGLLNAFRIKMQNEERQKRVRALVKDEIRFGRRQFCLAASSGFNYLKSPGHVWLDAGLGNAIHNGAHFNVVLQSPFSSFGLARALACEGVNHHHWEEKVSERELEALAKLNNVVIKVTELPVNCSLFITTRSVFYDPYLWAVPASERPSGRPENNFWVFEFAKNNHREYGCYELLREHFRFLFEHSISLPDFLYEQQSSYKERSDNFRELLRNLRSAQR